MEKVVVDVMFRKYEGEVIAIFPHVPNDLNGSFVASYSHNGQHSSASHDFVSFSFPASDSEYSDLKKELESIGYDLNIVKKTNKKKLNQKIIEIMARVTSNNDWNKRF